MTPADTPLPSPSAPSALDRARRKAAMRLVPLLFACYVIAYIDRANVAFAKLTMAKDLPGFDNEVFGFGAGCFFFGYFLLEIPGTLIVERWSARKWMSRIMITWGIIAALTAFAITPMRFYVFRFLLGLAEAGFFPGAIVYLTHWFPRRDRAKAIAWFATGTPIAQMISPKISSAILTIGTDEMVNGQMVHHPELWGLEGWQWLYIFWGLPSVILGVVVLFFLTDRPRQAMWLQPEEREALENELARERAETGNAGHGSLWKALFQRKVVLLALAYFFGVTAFYGIEFFLPTILERWYGLKLSAITSLALLPGVVSLLALGFAGWSSDHFRERRWHAAVPLAIAGATLALTPLSHGVLAFTMVLFVLGVMGAKAFLPGFWALPSLFLTESAAAATVGFINSFGNLGGFVGPFFMGKIEKITGSFDIGLYFLGTSAFAAAVVIVLLGLGKRVKTTTAA